MDAASLEDPLLIALVGMGFDEGVSRRALRVPGITNVEQAINWVLTHGGAEDEEEDEDEEDEPVDPMKMIVCIRTDLNMSPGKVAAQSCHASLAAYRLSDKSVLKQWEAQGEPVICLSVESDAHLDGILMAAATAGLVVAAQFDAGRTEVDPNTRTCGAIGPFYNRVIDTVTRSLRLYK
jgi:peptidyl-tRNA hydrolase, PTH2 family